MSYFLGFILLIALIFMLWLLEGAVARKCGVRKNAGVKLIGPMYSISARGTIGKAFTFLIWKGIQYAREYFIPANPQTAKQVNIRTAMQLIVAYWLAGSQERKDKYKALAKGEKFTGMNYFISRALKEYIVQLGTTKTPASVVVVDDPPNETWTWTEVV